MGTSKQKLGSWYKYITAIAEKTETYRIYGLNILYKRELQITLKNSCKYFSKTS